MSRRCGKHASAKRKILGLQLFLEGDGVGGHDHLPLLVDCLNDAWEQVGEGLAHAGAGFKEQRKVVGQSARNCGCHLGLLRAIFESKRGLEDAAFREKRGRQHARLGGACGRCDGKLRIVAQTDHTGGSVSDPNPIACANLVVEGNDVQIGHADAARACGGAQFVFVTCAVDVDVAMVGVDLAASIDAWFQAP